MVLIQSTGSTAADPAFRAAAVEAQRRLAALPHSRASTAPRPRQREPDLG